MVELTEKRVKEIYNDDYISNGMAMNQIGKKYGVSGTTIRRYFKKYNLKAKTLSDYKKYSVNDNYFETIDTENKAYWLGFLYADGCVQNQKNTVSLVLAKKDYNHLVKFKNDLNSEYNIRTSCVELDDGRTKEYVITNITSKKMVADLVKNGCIPRKTFTCTFPDRNIVPVNLVRHFIRGVFDGDGCVVCHNNKIVVSIAGNINIVSGIQKELYNSNVLEKEPHIYSAKSIYTVDIFGKYNAMRMMEYFYSDATVYLERKYEKFIEIKNNDLVSEYAKYRGIAHKCDICNDENSVRYVKWHGDDEFKNYILCNKHYGQLSKLNRILDDKPYTKPLIYCLTSGMIFETQKEAAEWAGLKSSHGIRLCIEGKQKTSGHHPDTGELLQWAEYDESKLDEFNNYEYNCTEIFQRVRERPIYQIDMETNEILRKFSSSCEAGRWLGLKNFSNITSCCKGRRNHAFGYKWCYVDEYDSKNNKLKGVI